MTNGALPRRTALIVDDDPGILEVLAAILEDVGFATTSYEDGQSALTALTQGHFDLLLIDQWLPDINGLQICAVAHQRYGNSAVVVMITADPSRERHAAALTTCADDVVGKPFNVDLLVARLEAKLRRKTDAAA